MNIKIPAPVLVASLVLLLCIFIVIFGYGVAVERYRLFPYKFIDEVETALLQTVDTATGQDSWYYPPTDRTKPIEYPAGSFESDALNLVTAMGPDKSLTLKVIDMNGNTVHQWAVDWFDIWSDATHLPEKTLPKSKPGTHIHGTLLLPNGDIVFNFEKLGTVRMGVCGDVQWKLAYQTHHSIYLDENQTLWLSGLEMHQQPLPDYPMHIPPIREPTVVQATLDGEILDTYSVFDLLAENDQRALLQIRSAALTNKVTGDSLHLNDVETFPSDLEEGVFRHGDVMLSLRNINTILVYDPETQEIRFMKVGGFVRQHDPDFIDGNTIMLFDNNNIGPKEFGQQSRILYLDARTSEITTAYEGDDAFPFYTPIMGKQQLLEGGNLLITDSVNGRGFEIDATGQVVWEYINIVEDGVIGIVEEVERIPASYREVFTEAACGTAGN